MISKGPLAHIFVQEHSHLAMKLSQEKLFASLSSMAFWFLWDFPKRNLAWSQPHKDIQNWVPPAENPGLFLSPSCSAPVHKYPKEENDWDPRVSDPFDILKNQASCFTLGLLFYLGKNIFSMVEVSNLFLHVMQGKDCYYKTSKLCCLLCLIPLFIIFPTTRQT